MINVFTQVGLGNQDGTPKNFAAILLTIVLPTFGNNLLQYVGQSEYDFTNSYVIPIYDT